jgi:lysophospholipase L1-like esterase
MTIRNGPKIWSSYVALGDSLTEGLADARPNQTDSWYGWADRLAVKLAARAKAAEAPFAYANLAVRGRLLADIAGRQVDQALELRPDLVSLWGGGNDCLRPGADIAGLAATLEAGVVKLRRAGCDVLLNTAYDPSDSPMLRWTTKPSYELTQRLWAIADRHDCYVTDVWNFQALHDLRMWAEDLIHLTNLGHQRLSDHALAALGCPVDPAYRLPLPPPPPVSLATSIGRTLHWGKIFLLPWLHRRLTGRSSGDGRVGKRLSLTPVDDLDL